MLRISASQGTVLMVNPIVPEMMPAIDDFKVAPNRDDIRLTLTVTGKDEMDVP
jgi:hypothetical protein